MKPETALPFAWAVLHFTGLVFAQQPAGSFRAGASIVDITPQKFPVIVNAMFEERSADKAVDRLFARCLVLDNGAHRIAFAVVDTCMLPRELIDRAKELATAQTQIPTERMLISATHTHSAPAAMGCLGSRADPEYAAWLPGRIAEGLAQAAKQLAPARVGWAVVDDWEHTFNRRWIRRPDRLQTDPFGMRNVRANMHPGHQSADVVGPSGPVDPGLSLLAVQSPEGRPIALLANYSQHYYGSPLLSSDYYGRFAQHIAQLLGANERFVAMMSQGTSGDLMWMDYSAPARDVGYDAYAKAIAERVHAAYRTIAWKDWAPLAMVERKITLSFRTPDAERLAWAREVAAGLKGRLPRSHPEIYALEAIHLHERPTAELKLQAIRIGDLGIAAIPNEVFALTGLKIKAQSPLQPTFNIELANGAEGYIPPPEQHALGGYTTWPARTAGLVPEAEPRIVETMLALLEEAAGKPRRPMEEEHGPYAAAVLAGKPVAYWRLNDATTPKARDASGHGHDGTLKKGVALWLPGVDARSEFQPPQPQVPNAFSGSQINRSTHFAGGRLKADLPNLRQTYSVEFWLWNGFPNDARPVTGYAFSRGVDGDKDCPGDHLGIGGTSRADTTGRLIFFNGNKREQLLSGRRTFAWREWHHVVLVRDGPKVTAWLNGSPEPELSGECDVTLPEGARPIFIGGRSDNFANFEGKLDEVAIYDRALSVDEIVSHYRASGFTPAAPEAKPTTSAPPLSPEESLKKLHVRAGFRAELVAAEPLTLDPVAIDWDAAGRLWVVEMADYPLGLDNKGAAGGRVRILEDIDNDGRYDKATLFAEGLNMPTGLLTWRDGVLVTTAPEILFLKDSNGDGRADIREVLYSGFQVGNPQLRVNGLRWGLDNWIYCAAGGHHGNYGVNTRIRSMRLGAEVLVGSRDVRLRPDTGEIEPQSGPSQFGRNRDEWGHWFGTQNSWPLWHYVLADHYVRRNPHFSPPDPTVQVITPKNPKVFPAIPPDKRYHSFSEAGHFTSACSGMIYGDEILFPRGETMHAFTCEPFHNLVHHELVSDEGVSFRGRRAAEEQTSEFFASEDRWFRPVMTRTGPDGALWVVDMYRYMIEHPEWLPPEGRAELLPHYREGDDKGRIYRVVRTGVEPRQPPRLDQLSIAGLVAALDSPNSWQRDKAQQLLVWRRDRAAVPLLEKLARESSNSFARLHALCTLDGIGALSPELVVQALSDSSAGVRENALRLAETHFTSELIAHAHALVGDPSAKVRLQLASTLGQWKDPSAGEALGKLAIANHADRYISAAVMSSAVPHCRALAEAVANAGDEALKVFTEPLLNLCLALGERDALARLIQPMVPADGAKLAVEQVDAFTRFLDALGRRKSSLADLAHQDDALSRLLRSAPRVFDLARDMAEDAAASPAERVAAAALLTRDAAQRPDAMQFLAAWLTPQASPHLQRAAIHALAGTRDQNVPTLLKRAWAALGPETRMTALDELLGRNEWSLALLAMIEKGELASNAFDTARRDRVMKHPSAEVRAAAARVFAGGPSADRAKVIEQFRPALLLKGDAARGLTVYQQRCASCHRRGDTGNDIGPELRSVIAHEPERLLAGILDPNADVQPGYHAYHCRLASGEELYGIITAETGTSITVKLPDATTRTVLRSDIAALESSNVSLMPTGLEADLTSQQMADLIAFLRSPP